MRVLFVLEDKGESKALTESASSLGLKFKSCDSLAEGESLVKQHAFDAVVLRRGRGSIALKSFLRSAHTAAPSMRIFLLGSSPGGQADTASDEQIRALVSGSSIEILVDAPPTEVIVRLLAIELGRRPSLLGYESLQQITFRRSWTSSLARDRATGEQGVLATLDPHLAADEEALEELGRVLPPALAVKHASLGAAKRVDLERPVPLVFWPVPAGAPVSALTERRERAAGAPLPIEGALGLIALLAGALDALHTASIIHGAVAPWAVWACADGGALLLHQGFAAFAEEERRRTRDRRHPLPFSEDALAPEKLMNDRAITPAVDVYGAGLVLYEMLCGARPFQRDSAMDTLQAILQDAPTPPSARRPDVPAQVSALVLSMLAKAPEDRPQNGAELLRAVEPLLPKAGGLRRLFGGAAKPEALVAAMLQGRAEDVAKFSPSARPAGK
jgi:hypothetical protein